MPHYVRNDMHDVAVALDLHELCHANGTEFCDAADVIPRKIDKHDVFGPLLRIAEQLSGVGFVFFRGQTAGACPCDWTNLHRVAIQPDMHLRRTTDERKIGAEVETKHVRRRIDETKAAIEIEWFAVERRLESLRQNDLEDITCGDVFLRSLYCALELFAREIASRQRLFCIFHDRNEAKIDRLRQLLLNRSQAFDSARIDLFRRTIAEKCVDDDFQAAQPVIEKQKHARDHEQRLRQLKFILLRQWNFGLEKVDCLVADKSDSAAGKPRQFGPRHELITRHQLPHLVDWIAAHFESPLVSVLDDPNLAPIVLQNHASVHTYERKTARDIVLFGGLKKETVTAAVQFLES